MSPTKLDEVDERDGQNASKYKDLNLNYTKTHWFSIQLHSIFSLFPWILLVASGPYRSTGLHSWPTRMACGWHDAWDTSFIGHDLVADADGRVVEGVWTHPPWNSHFRSLKMDGKGIRSRFPSLGPKGRHFQVRSYLLLVSGRVSPLNFFTFFLLKKTAIWQFWSEKKHLISLPQTVEEG